MAAAELDPVLVLSIREHGKHSQQLTNRLELYLERHVTIRPSKSLSAAEHDSRSLEFLGKLSSAQRARLILWGEVGDLPDHRRTIELRLYNTRTGANPPIFRTCPDDTADETLKLVADQLLNEQEQLALGEAPAAKPEAEIKPLIKKERVITRQERPRWRTVVGLSLATVGVGVLAGAITLTALQGRPSGKECRYTMFQHSTGTDICVYNNTGLFATGYVAAAALGVSSWLAFEWFY